MKMSILFKLFGKKSNKNKTTSASSSVMTSTRPSTPSNSIYAFLDRDQKLLSPEEVGHMIAKKYGGNMQATPLIR